MSFFSPSTQESKRFFPQDITEKDKYLCKVTLLFFFQISWLNLKTVSMIRTVNKILKLNFIAVQWQTYISESPLFQELEKIYFLRILELHKITLKWHDETSLAPQIETRLHTAQRSVYGLVFKGLYCCQQGKCVR